MDESIDNVGDDVRKEIDTLARAMLAQGVGLALCVKAASHQIREIAATEAAVQNKKLGQLAKSKANSEKQTQALEVSQMVNKYRARYNAALQEWLKANATIESSLAVLLAQPVSQNQVTMPSVVLGGVRERDSSESPAPTAPFNIAVDEPNDENTQPMQL